MENALNKIRADQGCPAGVLGRFFCNCLPAPEGRSSYHFARRRDRFNLPAIFPSLDLRPVQVAYLQSYPRRGTGPGQRYFHRDYSAHRKGSKPAQRETVRFVYDQEMDPGLLEYLIRRLQLTKRDNLIPGGQFIISGISWISRTCSGIKATAKPFDHPALADQRISDLVLRRDLMLHFPYHFLYANH